MRRRTWQLPILILFILLLATPQLMSSERLQRSVAAVEALVPLALLLAQGTDTPFELAVVGGSVLLQTVPNVLMLVGEATARPQFTRITRWTNFGIDSAIAGGLFGVGIAYLAGAFGQEADIRAQGDTISPCRSRRLWQRLLISCRTRWNPGTHPKTTGRRIRSQSPDRWMKRRLPSRASDPARTGRCPSNNHLPF